MRMSGVVAGVGSIGYAATMPASKGIDNFSSQLFGIELTTLSSRTYKLIVLFGGNYEAIEQELGTRRAGALPSFFRKSLLGRAQVVSRVVCSGSAFCRGYYRSACSGYVGINHWVRY